MVVPDAARLRTLSNSLAASAPEITAVGSSRIRIFGSATSALAISTICCRATLSELTSAAGSISGKPKSASTRAAMRFASGQSTTKESPRVGMRPSSMFSATLRCGSRLSSW